MDDVKENAIEWLSGQDLVTVTAYRGRIQNRILKLAETYPEETWVKIPPEQNNGFMVAQIPLAWVKIGPPKRMEMTEERRAEIAERLIVARRSREHTAQQ